MFNLGKWKPNSWKFFKILQKLRSPQPRILKFVVETHFLNLVYLKLCSAIHLYSNSLISQHFKLSPVIASPYFLSNVILKTFYIFLLELLVCKPAWKQRPRASVRQRNCYWHDIQYCQSFTHHFKAS